MLDTRGLEVIAVPQSYKGAATPEFVLDAIRRSSFVIAVIAGEVTPELAYEVGLARGRSKPCLVILLGKTTLPDSMAGLYSVRAERISDEQVRSALDRIVSQPHRTSLAREIGQASRVKPEPYAPIAHVRSTLTRRQAKELIRRLDTIPQERSKATETAQEFEEVIGDALRSLNLNAVVSEERERTGADFAVWTDELNTVIGNPVLIEVKLFAPRDMPEALYQLAHQADQARAAAGLLILMTRATLWKRSCHPG